METFCVQTVLFLSTFIIQSAVSQICYDPICEFTFVIHRERNLLWKHPVSGAVYEVGVVSDTLRTVASPFRPAGIHGPFLGVEVDPDEVITTDGVKRTLYTINRKFPAPNIEVAEGSQVVVHVANRLIDQAVTIHWHGQEMNSNPWMDGVPYITQCPILPSQNFTYRFIAQPAGTHWYHSHLGHQRNDGLSGLLVVHPRPPSMPYFNVLLQDWFHFDAHFFESTNPYNIGPHSSGDEHWTLDSDVQVDGTEESIAAWNSALINGRGRHDDNEPWPLTVFNVTQGSTYRFRVVNAGSEFPFAVSIDSHVLRVVALDGIDVEPVTVDSAVIGLGERVDLEVAAMQAVDNYWMRARTLKDLLQNPEIREVKAIISYLGAPMDSDPISDYMTCTQADPCHMLGCRFMAYPDIFNIKCLHIADMRHTYTPAERFEAGLDQAQPDVEYFLNSNIFPEHITFNSYTFIPPTSPVYQSDSYSVPCDTCPDDAPCLCTPTLNVPFNKTIQIVLTNYQLNPTFPPLISHPIHMHGQHFAVVKTGWSNFSYPGTQYAIGATPNPDITCDNHFCRNAKWTSGSAPSDVNLVNPPLKDTINVAPSGYVVLRFRSDNPGPWLLHCHISHHENAQGSMMVLMRAGEDHFPPVPYSMPTCPGQFRLSKDEFKDNLKRGFEALDRPGGYQKVQVPPTPCSPDTKGNLVLSQGALVASILGSIIFGILVATLVALACRSWCKVKQAQRVEQTPFYANNYVLPFQASQSRVFYTRPVIKHS